ncbi:hypothetical protein A5647_23235 [Mycobacterium sp. 1100029.7]|nr:hypothetical protein A5647_23235 [Mycobacterium sp. 1100029.7]
MSRLRSLTAATASAVILVSSVGAGTAHAQAPAPGDPCATVRDTTQDANGRTMWCNPTMTGDHSLVWQYGGPAD